MSYLEKLSIKGFKAFTEETSIGFKKLTVLAGANSVGKSSVIQALLLSRYIRTQKNADRRNKLLRVPLNGIFNLNLGTTRDITSSKRVNLDINLSKSETLNLPLLVPIDRNFLTFLTPPYDKRKKSAILDDDFFYLAAERIGPRVLYDQNWETRFLGFQGEYAIHALIEGLAYITPSELNFQTVTNFDGVSDDNLVDQVNLWMNYIIPNTTITANRLKEVNKAVANVGNHTMPNVGFGIAYVLPIVVAGLVLKDQKSTEKMSLLIIENPEAHLHPSGQTRIGEFLAAVAAQEGVQVIIETHSEHVINGIRVAALKDYIKPSDILVNFLHRDEKKDQKIQIRSIEIKDNGEFSSFPPGFFDQHAQNLIEMTKYRMKKK